VQTSPRLFGPDTYYWFQLLPVQFDPEGLPHKAGSRQSQGSSLQHRISTDIDGGFEVSVHKFHAFLAGAAACTHQCKSSSKSWPRCYSSIVVAVPSGKHLYWTIPLLRLRHLLFSARWSAKRGIFSFPFREPAMMALQDPRLSYPYLFLGVLSLQMNALRTRLL